MAEKVIIVQYDAEIAGSALSGLMLANGLREAGWDTHVVFGAAGPLEERYKENGHTVHVEVHKNWMRSSDPLHFLRNVLKEQRSIKAYTSLIGSLKPKLVYINTSVSLAGAIAARRCKVPCIWHLRELFSNVGGEMKLPPGGRYLARRVFKKYADRLIAVADAVAQNMLGGASEKVVEIVPNAVNSNFFEETRTTEEAREALGLPREGLLLGVPGTLRPMKGHPFFFKSFQRIADQYNTLTVAVTGGMNSTYARDLMALTKELGVDNKITFMGFVKDMATFYRACDVVCIPSKAEPFGRIVIEAFASKVPVIATAVGGIREIVTHGETGLLINYGNEQAFAEQIVMLLNNEQTKNELSENAYKKAVAEYHESVYKHRICTIVAETCGYQPNPEGVHFT